MRVERIDTSVVGCWLFRYMNFAGSSLPRSAPPLPSTESTAVTSPWLGVSPKRRSS